MKLTEKAFIGETDYHFDNTMTMQQEKQPRLTIRLTPGILKKIEHL